MTKHSNTAQAIPQKLSCGYELLNCAYTRLGLCDHTAASWLGFFLTIHPVSIVQPGHQHTKKGASHLL